MAEEKARVSSKPIKKKKNMPATKIIALAFLGIILVGTLLLMLPVASRDGRSCGFISAFFTATSATCVTGLTVVETGVQWSGFGQIVILTMIEIGGLGFMSAASLVLFLLKRKVGLRHRMVMAQALSVDDMESIVRLQKWVLLGSLLVQVTGALVLSFRLLTRYDWVAALAFGVFHSVSAFCNAGFDILGLGNSVNLFNNDPVILLTLSALVVIGGLGFFVWEEVVTVRRFRKFSVYTKLVLITSGVLILGGAVLFALLEWNNPGTLGGMPVGQKLLNSLFQSVTLRTAGFASVNQGALTEGGKATSIVIMLIGGSSGSTAGGIKTVTFVVMLLFIWSRMRGKNAVTAFRRNIPTAKITDAMTITTLVAGLAVLGAVFISAVDKMSFTDSLYETVSALATVGLTTGITSQVSVLSQLLLIVFMYFGRVGILTISLGFLMGDKAQDRIRYADTNLLIG